MVEWHDLVVLTLACKSRCLFWVAMSSATLWQFYFIFSQNWSNTYNITGIRPGQVVKLSTSGRLAALFRAAGHQGWCFFGSKTVDQRSGANAKKPVFCWNLLQVSCFFRFFAQKTLKMTISTSVWRAQHLNAGRNI